VAEREGFEPSRGFSPLLAFQASAFNRSTTSPNPHSTASNGGPNRFYRRSARFARCTPPNGAAAGVPPTSSNGGPNRFYRRSARFACCTPPNGAAAGVPPTALQTVVAVLLLVLLVGAAPSGAQRHAVAGHFNVPRLPAPRPTASASLNLVTNSGFESGSIDSGWYQCGDVNAYATTEHPYLGRYEEYSGVPSGVGEPLGNSGICQRVTIPQAGVLTARLYQLSNERGTAFAYQEADLLDDRGNVVVNLFRAVNNRPEWVLGRWNLDAYAGRTLWIYFGVHGDGYPKLSTQQFLDDVILTGGSVPAKQAHRYLEREE
jgi:hypothetical protein